MRIARGNQPTLVHEFAGWVREEWQVDICDDTACRWLHELGFSRVNHSKGVYFDGQECADVVEYDDSKAPNFSRPIIRVYHDESTFDANAGTEYRQA